MADVGPPLSAGGGRSGGAASTRPVLVLASASPARRATLASAGVDAVVVVSDVDEDAVVARYGLSDPGDVALVLARAKAEDVASRHTLPAGAVVLGCDSVLDLDGTALGKPADASAAVAAWQAMRGRSGVLRTGHWVVDTRHPEVGGSGATIGAVGSTTVHFADVSDAEVAAYVATGEPMRVAGAFTVDGLGGPFVRGVEGDHHAVVGVSLPLLRDLLADAGVAWTALWRASVADVSR